MKKNYIHETCLSIIVELANNKRNQNAAFFTNKFLIEEIIKKLPLFDNKKKISIIEPSVGAGNFLPYIFQKYAKKEKVDLTLVEIDPDMVEILQIIYDKTSIPKNFNLKFICQDFLKLKHEKVDLIIGNPPFNKAKNKEQKIILKDFKTPANNNLASFFLEKSLNQARYVSLIMPKNFLSAPIYDKIREQIKIQSILDIIDFGNKGFEGVSLETINFMVDNKKNLRN
nr:N-6 DNA methylase [Italian clover phyllody phytoplasma]